jgi:TetR/AcrR family transcriptional regulator, regulator of cefoperazone and chloramphenicol sensitivity
MMLYDITLEPLPSPRAQRSDGAEARERLLRAALKLFADKGFAKASTREIAQAAGTNVAAIRYYFGDKAGLYRAAFTEPLGSVDDEIALYARPGLPLRQALEGFFNGFLESMKQGELVQQCTRLRYREMLEPTGLWMEELDKSIRPIHAALAGVICRHLGLVHNGQVQDDDDVHRLVFSIVGLAMQLFIGRDVIEAIRPQLLGTPEAIDRSVGRLADYAEAMVAAEAMRRRKTIAPMTPANDGAPSPRRGAQT